MGLLKNKKGLCHLVHYPTFSFSVHVFQCTVYLLHLRRQCGKFAADIRGDFFLAMNTFVLFNVLCHFFGNHIMVPEQAAEKRSEFVTVLVLVGRSFHKPVLFGKSIKCDLGNRKMP